MKTFREMYVAVNNAEIRNCNLKKRLHSLCQRTLRSQVTEYVRYTNRILILQEYTPSADEEKLYNFISDYLQTDKLYALPEGQRTLITMVLRKLLASSSFAISGTLNSLIERLNNLLSDVALSRGYYFSINHQMIKNQKGRNIINRIPIEKILIESDAPFTIGLNSDYNIPFANELIDFLSLSRNIDKTVLYM